MHDPERGPIDRTELYSADEIFVCGSAAEVNHVTSVDRTPIGDGASAGPITQQLQELYQRAVRGRVPGLEHWVTPVYATSGDR